MTPYFITGLPRSRTAWLANYLTWGSSLCLHDVYATLDTPHLMPDHLEKAQSESGVQHIGVSDPALLLFASDVIHEFPHAPWVVIKRDHKEVVASCEKAFGTVSAKALEIMARELDRVQEHAALVVPFDRVTEMADQIGEAVMPGWSSPKSRLEMLARMQVQIHPDILAADLRRGAPITKHVRFDDGASEANKRYVAMVEAWVKDQEAMQIVRDVWATAHVLDHIVDPTDMVTSDTVTNVFTSLLIGWPLNKFLHTYRDVLVQAFQQSLDAWRSGRPGMPQYLVYVLIPARVAWLCSDSVNSPDWFEAQLTPLVRQLMDEDNAKDVWQSSQV